MGRNIPLLLLRLLWLFLGQFLPVLARGIGFVLILLLVTMFGVLRGIWEQSDFVANSWRSQTAIARMDGHFDGPMYWTIRVIALLLMIICLVVLAEGLCWLIEPLVGL